jgi:hypothetical protein
VGSALGNAVGNPPLIAEAGGMAPGIRRADVSRGCRGSFPDLPDDAEKRGSVGLSAQKFPRKALRAKTDFLNAFNVICPVQSSLKK